MDGRGALPRVTDARRMDAHHVAQQRGAPGLVEGRPETHPVPQGVEHDGRVVGEAVGHVPRWPATGVLEDLGQVPVVDRQVGLDARRQQLVHEAPVEVQAGLVHASGAPGQDARPGHAEAIGVQSQGGHEGDVLAVAVVVVVGDIAGVAVLDGAGHSAEHVPDRWASARPPPRRPRSGRRSSRRPTGSRPGKVSSAASVMSCRSSMLSLWWSSAR